MWRMFANIYLYLPLTTSNGSKHHVVENDEFRFQPESIYNAAWRMFAYISFIFTLIFLNWWKNDMLLTMINSDFSQKSFVMLCEECLHISIYIYPLFFSNGVSKHVVEYDKLLFQREIICNVVCEECLQISIYIYHLFSQLVKKRHIVEYD